MRLTALLIVCSSLFGCPQSSNDRSDLTGGPPDLTPGVDLSTENDLSASTPGDMSMPPSGDMASVVRAVLVLDIDQTPSPSPNPTPAPYDTTLAGMFYDKSPLAPVEETKINAFITDPYGYETIAAGTCGAFPLPNLGSSQGVSVGESVKLVSNGSILINAPRFGADNSYGATSQNRYTTFLFNPGIDVFVVDQLSIGGEINLGHVSLPAFPTELKQPFTITRGQAKTFSFSTGGLAPFDRLGVDLGNGRICTANVSTGSLTVPASETSGLAAGAGAITFLMWPKQSFGFSAGSVSFTPRDGGARTSYSGNHRINFFPYAGLKISGTIN